MPAAYQIGVMPTTMPALDAPIAASRPGSVVVDFPFGICGGIPTYGAQFPPQAQVLATADGHPRAIGFIARAPTPTIAGIKHHPFYSGLIRIWRGTTSNSPAQVADARLDARRMNIGWVLIWPQRHQRHGKQVTFWNHEVLTYLHQTGFHFAYHADTVLVYGRQAS